MYTAIKRGQRENLYIPLVLVHIVIYINVANIDISSSYNIFTTNASLFITFKI